VGYYDYMAQLLRPLGLYSLDEGYSALELKTVGRLLDALDEDASLSEREAFLATAEAEGLTKWEELFPYRTLAQNVSERRAALAALMRIDGKSFTPSAINDTVKGSGYNALVEEGKEHFTVVVSFPNVRGVPMYFPEAKLRIESILPCHLNVVYIFTYPTWAELDAAALTWGELDAMALTWQEFESTDFAKL